jgi:MFS family permease
MSDFAIVSHAGPLPRAAEARRWWVVAAAALGMGLGFGVVSSLSVFMVPLGQELGWPRASIAFAYTLMTIAIAAAGLLWGRLADRINTRATSVFGAAILGLGLLALSRQESLYAFYAIHFVLGAAGFACLYTPLIATVGLWFDKRRGLAIGLVTAGGALGQGVVPLAASELIGILGWRGAYEVLGLAYLALLVPAMALVTKPAAPAATTGTAPAQRPASQWSMPPAASTAWISAAAFFCCVCMAVPIMHLPSLAVECGLPDGAGASALMTAMAAGAIGRIFFGTLADRIGALAVYAIASLIQTATAFWFTQTDSLPAFYLLAAIFGFGFAGNMTAVLLSIREAVPVRMLGFSTAITTLVAWLGMGVGGFVAGWIFDATGDYTLAFAFAAAAGAANLMVLAAIARLRRAGESRSAFGVATEAV